MVWGGGACACVHACVRVHGCEHEDENSDKYDGKVMMANVKHLCN